MTGIPLPGKSMDKVREYGLGVMISTCRLDQPEFIHIGLVEFTCAIDNGRFGGTRSRNHIWTPLRFLNTIERCQQLGIKPLFVTVPDIVAGGLRSLECSVYWAKYLLAGPLALVVQDGISPADVTPHIDLFSVLFVGGSVRWKWKEAEAWRAFAHRHGKHLHIGQVGTAKALHRARAIGADSVDSVSFIRNKSWHHLDEFRTPTQRHLFHENHTR